MPVEICRYAAIFLPVALCCLLAGCPKETTDPSPIPSSSLPSPNANILPAPLKPPTDLPPSNDAGASPDASFDANRPPPATLREDVPLQPDEEPLLDPHGITLKARFRWHGLRQPPTAPEVDPEAIANARQKTERAVVIDAATAGLLRIEIAGPAFPLPPGTELRARTDYYGHALVWPDGVSYRLLQPGTLRALFEEGRADVGPLVPAEVTLARSANLLGYDTHASTVATSLGTAVLHQASIPDVAAGELLCRTLVELVGARPSTHLCRPGLVPVRAEYRWKPGGQLTFEVTSIVRATTLDPDALRIPPRTPSFKADRLPQLARATLLDDADLRAFRRRSLPVDQPDSGDAPGELVAVNRADTIRYLLVDGIPVARVPPRSERRLESLRPGRYVLSWVDFLGVNLEPARQEQVPIRVEVGAVADAGPSEP